jgi:hypothetical protein
MYNPSINLSIYSHFSTILLLVYSIRVQQAQVLDLAHRVQSAANASAEATSEVARLDRHLAALRAHEHLLWQQVARARQLKGDSERDMMQIRKPPIQITRVCITTQFSPRAATAVQYLETRDMISVSICKRPFEQF